MRRCIITQPLLQGFGIALNNRTIRIATNNLKAADLVFQRVTTMLDMVVFKFLVPLLTLLLGYVFGTRAGHGPGPSESE